MLRRDDGYVLRKVLKFEVKGKMKRGRPKKMWKTHVEKESKSVGLEEEDAIDTTTTTTTMMIMRKQVTFETFT